MLAGERMAAELARRGYKLMAEPDGERISAVCGRDADIDRCGRDVDREHHEAGFDGSYGAGQQRTRRYSFRSP
jgi:hypothetical protein